MSAPKAFVTVLALAVAATFAPPGHAAEDAQAVPVSGSEPLTGRERLERMKVNAKLHYELLRRHYDHALASMPLAQDIDMIEEGTGLTALGLACKDETADAIDMVQPLVVKFAATVNKADRQGFTALHYAADSGNYAVVEFLVDHGADVNAANSVMEQVAITPLYMAYQKGHYRIADFLKLRGADDYPAEVREQLAFSGALSQAAAQLRELPPHVDPRQGLRHRFEALGETAVEHLRSTGNIEAVEQWHSMKARLLHALENTPREPGMSKEQIVQAVMRNAFATAQTSADSAKEN